MAKTKFISTVLNDGTIASCPTKLSIGNDPSCFVFHFPLISITGRSTEGFSHRTLVINFHVSLNTKSTYSNV